MQNYVEKALRTAAGKIHPVNMQILHAAIGMVTEAAELDSAPDRGNYLEELGDIMWYVAIGCNELGVSLDEAEEMSNGEFHPVVVAADFIDLLKKQIFYGKVANPVDQTVLLGNMIVSVRSNAEATEVTLDWVLEQNIAKLTKRYPDKFSSERAINRDHC